jgi:hypothetical protein
MPWAKARVRTMPRRLERFLRKQFSPEVAAGHMARYQAFVQAFPRQWRSRAEVAASAHPLNSVKVLKICTQVNEELNQRQKFVVLVHLLEFISANGEVSEQEIEFVSTVAETFNIGQEDFKRCRSFVEATGKEREDAAHLLYIDAAVESNVPASRHLHAHGYGR